MADGDAGVLPRFIRSVARLRVRLNTATTDVGQRQRLNFIDSATVTWTLADSSVNEEVTVTATGATQTTPTMAYYGDGSDGAATLDGSTTVTSMAPSASVYTAVRDLYYTTLTINAAVVLNMGGYRLLTTGTLTNNGTIRRNGPAGTAGVGGVGGTGGTAVDPGYIGGSGAGGNGASASSTGTIGQGVTIGGGGNAGAGGASGGGNAGGAAGTAPAPAATSGGLPRALPTAAIMQYTDSTPNLIIIAGGAGGGGGGAAAASSGGGGGAGGGVMVILAQAFAGTGSITTTGGAGGAAGGTNGGGGGGGGGGFIAVISSSVSAGAISGQTFSVAAGAGGAKTGTGVAGGAGSTGNVILIPG